MITHLMTVCCAMMNSSLWSQGLVKDDHSVVTFKNVPLRVRIRRDPVLKGWPMDCITRRLISKVYNNIYNNNDVYMIQSNEI